MQDVPKNRNSAKIQICMNKYQPSYKIFHTSVIKTAQIVLYLRVKLNIVAIK